MPQTRPAATICLMAFSVTSFTCRHRRRRFSVSRPRMLRIMRRCAVLALRRARFAAAAAARAAGPGNANSQHGRAGRSAGLRLLSLGLLAHLRVAQVVQVAHGLREVSEGHVEDVDVIHLQDFGQVWRRVVGG